MPITPVQPAAITRFFAVEVSEILFCPSIANPAAPTFAELDAGTDLTRDISDITGWSVSTAFIDLPDLKNRYVGQLPGRITAEASALTFYADKLQVDIRELLPRDTTGFVVIADGGLASAIGDVFPVIVASSPKVRSMEDAAKIRVDFAITAKPQENVTLPQS